jgi:hypothetical protein
MHTGSEELPQSVTLTQARNKDTLANKAKKPSRYTLSR